MNKFEERKSGLYTFLSSATIYNTFQRIIGGRSARKLVVDHSVNPHLTKGSRVLAIGCGTGYLLDFLNEDIDYIGFDLDQKYIDFAKRNYGEFATFYCKRASSKGCKAF